MNLRRTYVPGHRVPLTPWERVVALIGAGGVVVGLLALTVVVLIVAGACLATGVA